MSPNGRKRTFVRKYTFRHVRPLKIQISLRILAVWSESSLVAFSIDKDAKFLHAATKTLTLSVYVGVPINIILFFSVLYIVPDFTCREHAQGKWCIVDQ